jgi:hypothetical protein
MIIKKWKGMLLSILVMRNQEAMQESIFSSCQTRQTSGFTTGIQRERRTYKLQSQNLEIQQHSPSFSYSFVKVKIMYLLKPLKISPKRKVILLLAYYYVESGEVRNGY